MATILCDSREARTIAELQNIGVVTDVQQLNSPDFVLSDTVAVELKVGKDFTASMADGRLEEELPREKAMYPDLVLVLENFNLNFQTNFNPASIRGMLVKIAVEYKIPVIYTSNAVETAEILKLMAVRLAKESKNLPVRKQKAKHERPEDYREDFIQGFIGAGPTLTAALLTRFITPLEIIRQIAGTGLRYYNKKNTALLSQVQFMNETEITKVPGIGPEFIKQNRKLLGVD